MSQQLLLELKNVTAGYQKQIAIQDITMQIFEHDYIAVTGPNGGGKTTLIKVILGLLKPYKGQVIFPQNGDKTARIGIGYLPQYNHIDKDFPINVMQLVKSGIIDNRLKSWVWKEDQDQILYPIMQKLDILKLKDRHIGQLSGGQLQRVLLARAMASSPRLLILDEPNTYIDKKSETKLYQLLKEINKQCAILVVSHDINEILMEAKSIACIDKTMHYHTLNSDPNCMKQQGLDCIIGSLEHSQLIKKIQNTKT